MRRIAYFTAVIVILGACAGRGKCTRGSLVEAAGNCDTAGVRMFLEKGLTIRAHDPEAMQSAAKELGTGVTMFEDGYAALDGADALVIFTDWPRFRTPDFDEIAQRLHQKLIFDGRNLYEPRSMAKKGFTYICIGRPPIPPA